MLQRKMKGKTPLFFRVKKNIRTKKKTLASNHETVIYMVFGWFVCKLPLEKYSAMRTPTQQCCQLHRLISANTDFWF